MNFSEKQEDKDLWLELVEYLKSELNENEKILKELDNKLVQSKDEIAKYTQKSARISSQIQKMQSQPEVVSLEGMQKIYELALEVQKRLFIMRGQNEKFNIEKTQILKNNSTIKHVLSINNPNISTKQSSDFNNVSINDIEMIIQAQETERQRLSRLMHDVPAQALSNFILQTDIAIRMLNADPVQAQEELESLKTAAALAFEKVRNFIFELRPMMLDDLGIVPTLKRYIETLQEQSQVEIRFANYGGEKRYKSYIEALVFRTIQELLENAIDYSKATIVNLQVDVGDSDVKINVDDNGQGFDVNILGELEDNSLNILRERIQMIGGKFEIDSTPGQGTRVRAIIPVER